MVNSMTAFARNEYQEDGLGAITWELRSVNHRYLDLNFRLPEMLRRIEMQARELIRSKIKRGKLDLSLYYQGPAGAEARLNPQLSEKLIGITRSLAEQLGSSAVIDVMALLSWPDVLQSGKLDEDRLGECALKTLDVAVDDLISIRYKEGQELCKMLKQRLTAIEQVIARIQPLQQKLLDEYGAKIRKRIEASKIAVDEQRVEQELVILVQKIDICEELDRLSTHLAEVSSILQAKGVVGRRLDFLMQELHRESNTIGSKSINVEVSKASVELKVLIEQMREQIQNIE